jgi:hypothetical protein
MHRTLVATLALALAIVFSGACGTTARQRRKPVGQIVKTVAVGTAALIAIGALYGLIACADENGGACAIGAGDGDDPEPELPQR